MDNTTRRIGGPAGVGATVSVSHTVDGQDTGLGPQHRRYQVGVRRHHVSLETPGDRHWLVTLLHKARYHAGFPLIDLCLAEAEWHNLWRLCANRN